MEVQGRITPSLGAKQRIELQCDEQPKILAIFPVDQSWITQKQINVDKLRQIPHQRHRVRSLNAVARIRSELLFSLQSFLRVKQLLNRSDLSRRIKNMPCHIHPF